MAAPAPPIQGNYNLGGNLVSPPMPDEPFYPLRRDQFLTFCDGEMSESRSIRDGCVGAFVTGLFSLAGIVLTIDWDTAAKQGKHPYAWTVGMITIVLVALIVGAVQWKLMHHTRNNSSYSRLVATIAQHLGVRPVHR